MEFPLRDDLDFSQRKRTQISVRSVSFRYLTPVQPPKLSVKWRFTHSSSLPETLFWLPCFISDLDVTLSPFNSLHNHPTQTTCFRALVHSTRGLGKGVIAEAGGSLPNPFPHANIYIPYPPNCQLGHYLLLLKFPPKVFHSSSVLKSKSVLFSPQTQICILTLYKTQQLGPGVHMTALFQKKGSQCIHRLQRNSLRQMWMAGRKDKF